MNPVVHLTVSTKLSRCLIVLALLCLVGETPVRLYGHLNWIESMQLDASESDLLAVLEPAFGQVPVLLLSHASSPSCFKPSNSRRQAFSSWAYFLARKSSSIWG